MSSKILSQKARLLKGTSAEHVAFVRLEPDECDIYNVYVKPQPRIFEPY